VFKKSNINPYAKIFCSACGISTLYGPEDLVISTWTRRA